MTLYSELYGAYYNAVAAILEASVKGERDERVFEELVKKHAFEESALTILPSLKSGKWQLMHPDFSTPLKHPPTMPMTILQKRWLKALSLDPRVSLFDLSFEGLEEVEPLFTPADFVVYDRYGDGDPYGDEDYQARFRAVLRAIREKKRLSLENENRFGMQSRVQVIPLRMEYSSKDDKFRLIAKNRAGVQRTFNMARLRKVTLLDLDPTDPEPPTLPPQMRTVTLTVFDERNALERAMLHFGHFEKKVERIDASTYRLHVRYDGDDESELIIRVLSFGPQVKADAPEDFVNQIRQRLKKQFELDQKG